MEPECFLQGRRASCFDPVAVGTEARLSCKAFHSAEPDFTKITCKDTGMWNREPYKCRPGKDLFVSKFNFLTWIVILQSVVRGCQRVNSLWCRVRRPRSASSLGTQAFIFWKTLRRPILRNSGVAALSSTDISFSQVTIALQFSPYFNFCGKVIKM